MWCGCFLWTGFKPSLAWTNVRLHCRSSCKRGSKETFTQGKWQNWFLYDQFKRPLKNNTEMYEVRLGWVGVFSGWGWSNLFSCRASRCVSPRGLKPALEWDSLASSGSFGAMRLPRREMAELILPSVCPATMNTGAIRDGVVLQPGRATKWDNALSSRFYYHLHTTHAGMHMCTN